MLCAKNSTAVQPLMYGGEVYQRHDYPSLQHTRTHRRHRAVEYVQQRPVAALMRPADQLQIADGKPVQPHIAALADAGDARDVRADCDALCLESTVSLPLRR
jgi:hypothetical protein